jgi:hypothetical protein
MHSYQAHASEDVATLTRFLFAAALAGAARLLGLSKEAARERMAELKETLA